MPLSHHRCEENGNVALLPYLKPSDMFTYLLEHFPWLCLGGLNPGNEAQKLLRTFWKLYKVEHPSHQLFQDTSLNESDLGFVIPLIMHGDGGRTLKKQPLECISLQPALGLDTNTSPLVCTCSEKETYSAKDFEDPMAQRLNAKNHSYLTHFCAAAFPSKEYRSTPGLLLSILRCICEDLALLCAEGVQRPEGRYRFATIGFKGDLEYISKCGMLSRSYQNVGHVNSIPCCSECLAGSAACPFEDFTAGAQWKRTVNCDVPWERPPPFTALAFERWDTGNASMWFRRDIFHIFRLGIARNFIGSTIVLLCNEGHFDTPGSSRAIDKRLLAAWANFSLWCHVQRERPAGFRSFSKEKLHMPTKASFPYIGCKGSDSILLLRWLKFFAGLTLCSYPGDNILTLVLRACEAGLGMQKIHKHGIWMKKQCRFNLRRNVKQFLYLYAKLAQVALNKRWTLFGMVPKAHSLDHFAHDIDTLKQSEFGLNPALWDCSMAEDFVGRLSRQSRRVSAKCCVANTLLAYSVKTKMEIRRFKRARNL